MLTVTAPENATGAPVMVWFYGGANVSRGGEAFHYDADDLARDGTVIVVTYRLGICSPGEQRFCTQNPDTARSSKVRFWNEGSVRLPGPP